MKKTLLTLVLGLLSLTAFATTHRVVVTDSTFTPASIIVSTGDTVLWDVASGTHIIASGTACTPDANFTSDTLGPGEFAAFRMNTVGVFTYFDQLNCPGPTGAITVQSTSIADATLEKAEFRTYPNPFADKATFEVILSKPALLTVRLYDLQGKLVHEQAAIRAAQGRNTFTPDLQHLSPGSYLTKIFAEGILVENRLLMKKE